MSRAGWPLPLAPEQLRQPDDRTCGPTAVLVARMLLDPDLAASVPATEVRAAVLRVHRELTGLRDAHGRLQVPWPRLLGTPPWVVVRDLSPRPDPSGAVVPHQLRVLRLRPARVVPDVLAAASSRPVVLFIGGRWLPRHVAVVVGGTGDRLRVFNPGTGRLRTVRPEQLLDARLPGTRFRWGWFAVLPATAGRLRPPRAARRTRA